MNLLSQGLFGPTDVFCPGAQHDFYKSGNRRCYKSDGGFLGLGPRYDGGVLVLNRLAMGLTGVVLFGIQGWLHLCALFGIPVLPSAGAAHGY